MWICVCLWAPFILLLFIIHSQSCEKRGQGNDRSTQLSPALLGIQKTAPLQVEEMKKFLSFYKARMHQGVGIKRKKMPLKVRETQRWKKGVWLLNLNYARVLCTSRSLCTNSFKKGQSEAGRYGWQADLLNTHRVSQTLKKSVQTHFPWGVPKKDRSFVREGRHARMAPEANRLDARVHKRESKRKNKRNLMLGEIYFRMENDISLFVIVISSPRHGSLSRE